MTEIKAVVFDFGATLFDLIMSEDDRSAYERSIYMALGQFASIWPLDDLDAQKKTSIALNALIPADLGEIINEFADSPIEQAFARGDYREHDFREIMGGRLAKRDIALTPRALDAFIARENMTRYIQAFTDESVTGTLETLKAQGYRLGVISNFCTLPEVAHNAFATIGLDAYFEPDLVIFSCDIGWRKPAPQIFHAWLDKAGGPDPAACVFVGDRLVPDIWGAQQVGLRAVLSRQYYQDAPEQNAPDGATIRPDAVIDSLDELPALLEHW